MKNDSRAPLIIAHRGASAYAPENTIAAFKKAVEMGFDLIENDVRRTRDGVIVVSHDGALDRCTDGTGQIAELALDQVKAVSAGVKFRPEYGHERIPTLEEALNAVPASVGYCIELKVPGLAEDVVRLVETMDRVDRTVIFAFDGSNGPIVKAANPLIPFLHLVGGPTEEKIARVPKIIEGAMAYHADIVGIAHSLLSPELVDAARRKGLSVWVWTVDDFERARECVLTGVDGIISNKPDIARQAVDSVYGK